MEIADVFVVNKADREGVDRVVAEIESMLSLATHDGHVPAIVRTVATADQGTEDLLAAIDDFRAKAEVSGRLAAKRRDQLRRQLEETVAERLLTHVWTRTVSAEERERLVDRLVFRQLDLFTAAEAILRKMGLS
jgi:LAO/AO transport system kinase